MLKLRAELLWFRGTGIDRPSSRTIKQEVQQSCREPAGLKKELLTKLKHEKGSYKGGSRIRSVRRKIETLSKHAGMGLGKAKPTWNSILARDVSHRKKSFFSYIVSKRKARKNTGLLLNGNGVLVT